MFLTTHSPDCAPIANWSSLTIITSSLSSTLSNGISTTPAALARLITGAKAVGLTAIVTIAS